MHQKAVTSFVFGYSASFKASVDNSMNPNVWCGIICMMKVRPSQGIDTFVSPLFR